MYLMALLLDSGACSFGPVLNIDRSSLEAHGLFLPNQTITIKCERGYYFSDMRNEVTFTCLGNDIWIPSKPKCSKCMYKLLHNIFSRMDTNNLILTVKKL